jgi:predicted membrane-bound dolichyl-phosphate-mannose-protein mannosyltransferase
LLLACLLCRVVWLTKPAGALIFDEAYYVNAARVILGWPVTPGAPYADQPAGRDPNHEHPPLGKALIAGSMRLLGDDPLGWRLPSLVAGMASIALIYGIVRAAGGDAWLGVLAAALFGFDNLAFVHARIGTLDMMLVAFLLFGVWCALRGQPLLAGMACALAALIKINGSYGLVALVLLELTLAAWAWRTGRARTRRHLRASLLLVVGFVPFWVAGLWLLDARLSTYDTPWAHLQFILQYGLALTRPVGTLGQESYPWQWLFNEVQMTYLRTDQQVMVNDQVIGIQPMIWFRGAMNPVIIGAVWLALPYALWRAWRCRDRLALWVVVWVVATYLPFFPLAMVEHRVSYLFYFLPTVPAVAVAVALLVRHAGLPRFVQWGYLIAVLLGFIAYFPFRAIPV